MAASRRKWDPSLYSGSAAYYPRGRLPYPAALAEALMHALHLDGHGRLLDVGCGPGSLTLPLADRFEQAIGLDADRGMIEQAERLAGQSGARNMRWVQMRAEDLPGGLGSFRLVTFAQSFHWLDRPRVARTVRAMLDDNGACARIHATTHQGVENDVELPHPRPPHAAIAELVRRYLGPVRRAGQGRLPDGTASGEDEIYRAAGFTGPQRIEIRGAVATRVTDDIIAAVFSLSSSAPHLFGDHLTEFETANRRTRSPSTSGSRERHVRARHRPVRNGGSASRAGCRRARALSRARFRPAVSLAACT